MSNPNVNCKKIKKYIEEYNKLNKNNLENELEHFRKGKEIGNLERVIRSASDKSRKHQHRIKKNSLQQGQCILLIDENQQEIWKLRNENFEKLYNKIVELLKDVEGLGDLYYYDTALRIGVFFGLYPEKIYLHSGAGIGADNLIGKKITSSEKFIEKNNLPCHELFDEMECYQIENFLCLFRDRLKFRVSLI